MSELLSGSERLDEGGGATDVELIDAVRSGDTQAYGTLFDRHREAAMRLARQLVRGPDADDLVAESFIRVLATLQNGKGPDEFFRAYLLTAIRRLHVDRLRAEQRTRPTGDESELDREVEFVDPAEMHFEQSAAAAAFAALPERWQLVLWHLDVEGNRPADIAPLLGMSPNSVSALAYRAREGLRQAYLQQHLAPALRGECRTTTGLLGAYVRDGLSKRDAKKVDLHLEDCSRCAGLHLELVEVNGNLSGLIGPALLGPAFAGYAAAGAGASSAAVGLKLLAAPVKTLSASVSGSAVQGVVAAAVVTSVAAAGTIAVTTDFNTAGQRTSVTAAGPADTPASTDPSGSSPVVDEAAAPRAPRTSSVPTTPTPGIPSAPSRRAPRRPPLLPPPCLPAPRRPGLPRRVPLRPADRRRPPPRQSRPNPPSHRPTTESQRPRSRRTTPSCSVASPSRSRPPTPVVRSIKPSPSRCGSPSESRSGAWPAAAGTAARRPATSVSQSWSAPRRFRQATARRSSRRPEDSCQPAASR
ncbi:sigma-70 family RNA polymerase sigma factor [Aeromicrobium sp. UC242_57]|uniref:sigma-70 family RNA polymerase sigma factor n=1 Tax=Aeromicrobium sp. UC242_57 TaxID=3374624 RepID=UPI003790450C